MKFITLYKNKFLFLQKKTCKEITLVFLVLGKFHLLFAGFYYYIGSACEGFIFTYFMMRKENHENDTSCKSGL